MRSLLAALMVLAASPTMAQVAAEFGPVVASVDDWQNARIGLYGGVSLDLRDCFSIAALYVQRGQDCCLRHSIEMPVTYRHRLDEVAYAIAGVAPSYAGEYSDVGVLAGLGVGMHDSGARTIQLELAYVHGLLVDILGGEEQYQSRTFRVGLSIR